VAKRKKKKKKMKLAKSEELLLSERIDDGSNTADLKLRSEVESDDKKSDSGLSVTDKDSATSAEQSGRATESTVALVRFCCFALALLGRVAVNLLPPNTVHWRGVSMAMWLSVCVSVTLVLCPNN